MVTLDNIKRSITNSEYTEQYTKKSFNSPTLQSAPVFVLCEKCYWCATYLDKNRVLKEEGVDDDNNKMSPM